VLASQRAKRKHIDARILPPLDGLTPRTSAIRYALRANCAHGLRLTPGDQRNKARRALLEVPGMVALSDRKIASELNAGHQTVSRARCELVRERRIPHPLTGEKVDEFTPDQYASAVMVRSAFGGVERFRDVLAYVRQLAARVPKDWDFDEEQGGILHSGLFPERTVVFSSDDNPVIDGLPRDWRAIDEDNEDPRWRPTEEQRIVTARLAARREFADAKRRIEARGRADLTTAARTLAKYRDVPGLWPDLQALVLAGGPPEEHHPEDF
jgi:hypothetical protein